MYAVMQLPFQLVQWVVFMASSHPYLITIALTPYAAMDESLITEGTEAGQYGFFVHPGGTVHVPFKYQTFQPLPQPSPPEIRGWEDETNGDRKKKKTIKV